MIIISYPIFSDGSLFENIFPLLLTFKFVLLITNLRQLIKRPVVETLKVPSPVISRLFPSKIIFKSYAVSIVLKVIFLIFKVLKAAS